MSVVLIHEGPTVTSDSYHEVVRGLTDGQKDHMDSPSDWPVDGLLVHAAGEGPNGFRVIDVWESEEACNRFGEVLRPHLEAAGITEQPEIYETHVFVSA